MGWSNGFWEDLLTEDNKMFLDLRFRPETDITFKQFRFLAVFTEIPYFKLLNLTKREAIELINNRLQYPSMNEMIRERFKKDIKSKYGELLTTLGEKEWKE